MTELTAAQRLAALAATTACTGAGDKLRADARRRTLDVLGNAVSASTMPIAETVHTVAALWGEDPTATAVGSARRISPVGAAFVNGTLAHARDFDDTHMISLIHPSSSVVPAALAVAESRRADACLFLDAVAVGIEVTVRLGVAGHDPERNVSEYFERGLHATSICGAVGAAVAAGIVGGLDEAALADVIGVASSYGSGLLEANRTGGSVKKTHCGWAAHSGIVAASLVEAGLTGPPTVVEGRFGLLYAMCGTQDATPVVAGLGETWLVHDVGVKPYPANHFTHAGIDAALAMKRAGLRADDIDRATLFVPTAPFRTIGEPREEKVRPQGGYHAAFSGPFTVAAAFVGGSGLGLGHTDVTDERASDPNVLSLAEKIDCRPDPGLDQYFPRSLPARLEVTTTNGAALVEEVLVNRGSAAAPLSDAELRTKLAMNLDLAGLAAKAEPLAEAVAALGVGGTVTEVMDVLR